MPTKYKIHLKNLQSADKDFWCFLNIPQSNISSQVFANSSAQLTVSKYEPGRDDSFTIPLQYVLRAGASNEAVALNTLIESGIRKNTDLASVWHADYFPANKGPNLYLATDEPSPGNDEVDVWTNNFDKSREPLDRWFSNLTFGVQSQNGFMGVTWSPDPGQTYRIKPKVQFYISTGSFTSDTLADIVAISSNAAPITEDSFDGNNECTVTLQTNGKWLVEPGNGNLMRHYRASGLLDELVKTQLQLATAHSSLVEMVSNEDLAAVENSTSADEHVKSTGITFNNARTHENTAMVIPITGTVSVAMALGAGFAYMIASGIKLKISDTQAKGPEYEFTYSGTAGLEAITNAFKAGKEIDFSKK